MTRKQLLSLGATAEYIRTRVDKGELIPVHAGVYAVGHVPRSALARAAAAVLACGEGAALSHDSAAALYGLRRWPEIPEVSAPKERRRPGIRSHRSTTLSGDTRRRHGIRVTSPERTLADISPRLTDDQLVRMVNEARIAGHLGAAAVQRLLHRCPRARRLLNGPETRATRSELEDLFGCFVRRHRLPMPVINAKLGSREVDGLYPRQRLIVELDSWTYHQDRASFERDRAKDAAALARGYQTIRITHARLTRDGTQEAAQIRQILEQRDSRQIHGKDPDSIAPQPPPEP